MEAGKSPEISPSSPAAQENPSTPQVSVEESQPVKNNISRKKFLGLGLGALGAALFGRKTSTAEAKPSSDDPSSVNPVGSEVTAPAQDGGSSTSEPVNIDGNQRFTDENGRPTDIYMPDGPQTMAKVNSEQDASGNEPGKVAIDGNGRFTDENGKPTDIVISDGPQTIAKASTEKATEGSLPLPEKNEPDNLPLMQPNKDTPTNA